MKAQDIINVWRDSKEIQEYAKDAMKVTRVRLKELREEVGLTLTMLGKNCNKHHNDILSIEKGMTDPSLLLLNELLIALGIELDKFFDKHFEEIFRQMSEVEYGKM